MHTATPQAHQDLVLAYKLLLNSLDITFNEKGDGVYKNGGINAIIDGRILQLPTQEALTKAQWSTHIPFHPVCESVVRKESIVLKKLRAWVNMRLTISLTDLVINILGAAINNDVHAGLPPSCAHVLSLFPDVDKKAFELLSKIIQLSDTSNEIRMVNLYLKIGGELEQVPYRRACIVSFPIVEEFRKAASENSDVVYGIKTTKKAIRSISAMLDWVVGDALYSRGSNSDVAPMLDALLKSYGAIATRFTEVATMWSSIMPSDNYGFIPLDWIPLFTDLKRYRNVIPNLKDNVGDVDTENTNIPSVKQQPQQQTGNGGLPPPPPASSTVMMAPGVANNTVKRKIGASSEGIVTGSGVGVASTALNPNDDWTKTVQRMETVYPAYASFQTRGAPQYPMAGNPYPPQQVPYGYPGYPQQPYPMAPNVPYQQPQMAYNPAAMQQYPPQAGMPMTGYPPSQMPYQQPMPYGSYPQQQPYLPQAPMAPFATR